MELISKLKCTVLNARGYVSIRIKGQLLGICGFGQIGKAVARRAQAFDVQEIVHSTIALRKWQRMVGMDLDGHLKRNDVIRNHVSQSVSNNHFWGRASFVGWPRLLSSSMFSEAVLGILNRERLT